MLPVSYQPALCHLRGAHMLLFWGEGALGGRWRSGAAKCTKAPTLRLSTAKSSKAARALLSRCSKGVGLPLCQAPKAACQHQRPLSIRMLALCVRTKKTCILVHSMLASGAACNMDAASNGQILRDVGRYSSIGLWMVMSPLWPAAAAKPPPKAPGDAGAPKGAAGKAGAPNAGAPGDPNPGVAGAPNAGDAPCPKPAGPGMHTLFVEALGPVSG